MSVLAYLFFYIVPLSFANEVQLDLKAAIQFAVENSPSLEVQRKEMSISDMERKNAYSVFLPQLDMGSNYGVSGRDPETATSKYGSQFGVTLTENLYDNGISFLRYDSAKVSKKIAELNFSLKRDQLSLQIAAQFLNYSLVTQLLDVQKNQFEIIKKQFNSIASQYKQGIKTRRDYLRFKSELSRSQIQLQNATTRLQNTQAELVQLIASTEQIATTRFVFLVEPVKPALVKQIPTQKPKVETHWIFQIAKMRSNIFDNDVSISRRSYYPEFFLTGGASYGSADYWRTGSDFSDNDFTSWNAMLRVSFNLWDWGIRNRNITIAKDRKVQREKSIEVELNDFVAENEKLMNNIALKNNNFLTAQELLSIETDSYAFLESEYRNGRVSYLDLIIGLRDLLSAKIQVFESFYDLRTQLLQYKYHQGQLYEEFS